uniref:Uncharacterized protein n=1 Tax=Oncorhynchus kisutch TaxID=8019 RepID=A0A8C7FEL6_ONCKI
QDQSQSGGQGRGKKDDNKKKYEPPILTRVGKGTKKSMGPDAASKLPLVTPHTHCRLKLLKQERIKDYLLMEEFIRNQEKIEFPLPDEKTKRRIFNIHASRMTVADDVTLDDLILAKDDLSAICTEEGLMALRERRMEVTDEDFKKSCLDFRRVRRTVL